MEEKDILMLIETIKDKLKDIYNKLRRKHTKTRLGELNPHWKGGKAKSGNGYIKIYKPNHPCCDCNKYIYEHRLVMEKYLGRYLTKDEIVHHINNIKDDNKIKNLKLMNKQEHRVFHNKEDKK